MRREVVSNVVTDFFSIPAFSTRIIRSKITKIALADIDVSLTPLHFEIIEFLKEHGDLPVVEIGKRLYLSR